MTWLILFVLALVHDICLSGLRSAKQQSEPLKQKYFVRVGRLPVIKTPDPKAPAGADLEQPPRKAGCFHSLPKTGFKIG